MKRLILAAAVSLLAAVPAAAQTVVIVRHAEKADASADPVLSEAGIARAEALAQRTRDLHPDLILTSPMQRTRLTADPAARFHSVTPEAISLDGGGAAHIARIVERVRTLGPDDAVLIVGHSNTVPLIARALGYAEAADMPECEYDRFTQLKIDGATVTGTVETYGAPTTCS